MKGKLVLRLNQIFMEQVKHRIIHKMHKLSANDYDDLSKRTSYVYRNIRPKISSGVNFIVNNSVIKHKVKQAIYHGEY